MFAAIPTADNKISASRVTFPFAVFTVATTPFPLVSTLSTDALVMIFDTSLFQRISLSVLRFLHLPQERYLVRIQQ